MAHVIALPGTDKQPDLTLVSIQHITHPKGG